MSWEKVAVRPLSKRLKENAGKTRTVRRNGQFDLRLMQMVTGYEPQSGEALSKKLGASPSTIRRHTSRLKKAGDLKVAALVEPAKMGFQIIVMIGLRIEHGKVTQVAEVLTPIPNIKWLTITAGRFGMMIYAWFRSMDEMSEFINKTIHTTEGIIEAETFICLHVEKGLHT
jgi:Lrp/AsnC family transcriptional regulator, regulator for asnA, asnC and gidA